MENESRVVNPELVLVVPVFNRLNVLDLVSDLNRQTYSNFILIIIDHGTKKIQDKLSDFPWVTIISESPKLWFTGAVNRGLECALKNYNSQFIGLLNDDISLNSPNFLSNMLQVLEKNPRSLVAAACADLSDRVVYSSIVFKPSKFRFYPGDRGSLVASVGSKETFCDALPTRGLITRRETLVEVGILDEQRFPQYGSDYEWAMRAKRLGYSLIMTTQSWVKTVINDRIAGVSGRNYYPKHAVAGFLKDARNPYKNGSFPLIVQFSSAVFRPPYSWVYMIYHVSRKTLGFLITNFFRRSSSQMSRAGD